MPCSITHPTKDPIWNLERTLDDILLGNENTWFRATDVVEVFLSLILLLLRNQIDDKKYQWYSFYNKKRMGG